MHPEPIAYIDFTDGTRRPVYQDNRGQYVVDADGTRVRGVWFIPRDEDCAVPAVVPCLDQD